MTDMISTATPYSRQMSMFILRAPMHKRAGLAIRTLDYNLGD